MAPYVKNVELISSTQNGTSTVVNSTMQQLLGEYAFKNSYTVLPSSTFTGPRPSYSMPYSNIGLQAGMSVNMHGSKEQKEEGSASDKYFYIKSGVGYAFPFANNISNVTMYNSNSNYYYSPFSATYSTHVSFKGHPVSFSAGINGTVGAGYMLGGHVGVELDAQAGIAERRYTADYVSDASAVTRSGYYNISSIKRYARLPVLLMPCVVLQTGGEKINVYSRLGVVLPLRSKMNEEDYEDYGTTTQGDVITHNYTYSTNFTLGYTSALGVKYPISKGVYLWGEVNMLSFEPYVKKQTETSNTRNGVEQPVASPLTYSRSGSYIAYYYISTTGTITTNGSTGSIYYNAPQPTYTLPFSSAGLWLGVSLRL